MAKTGRPSLYRKEFHNQDFLEQSNMGNDIRQIARAWGIDRSSIYEWAKKHKEFSHTIKKGQELCEAWYIDLGKAAMVGKAREKNGNPIKVDLGWYVWMTKNICRWTDKVEQKNYSNNKESITCTIKWGDEDGSDSKDEEKNSPSKKNRTIKK